VIPFPSAPKEPSVRAEFIELNDDESPGELRKLELTVVPRIGELIAFGELHFDVVNVIHRLDGDQVISVYLRKTKKPYERRKPGFGFGGR
jgi:hypothetical protein